MMCSEGCLSSQRSFDREEDTCTGRGGEAWGRQSLPNIVNSVSINSDVSVCCV